MAYELTQSTLSVSLSTTFSDLGQTALALSGLIQTGDVLPSLSAPLTDGTGAIQGNMVHAAKYTLAAAANVDIDLAGTSLVNPVNGVASFSYVRQFILVIDTPDGIKKLRVGPQGVANAAQLWFGGTGATVWEDVKEWVVRTDRYVGWPVVPATGDLLRINNPSAVSVDFYLVLLGLS